MPGLVLGVTTFWGLLLAIIGIITMAVALTVDDNDSFFYIAMGITLSGGFLSVTGVIIAILDAISKSSVGVG